MLSSLHSSVGDQQLFAGLPGINHFMLRAVVFKHPANIPEQRETEDHYEEEGHPNQSVDKVERYRGSDGMKGGADPGPRLGVPGAAGRVRLNRSPAEVDENHVGQQQWQHYEQEYIEYQRKSDRAGCRGISL